MVPKGLKSHFVQKKGKRVHFKESKHAVGLNCLSMLFLKFVGLTVQEDGSGLCCLAVF